MAALGNSSVPPAPQPLFLLRREHDGSDPGEDPENQDGTATQLSRLILCRGCGARIAESNDVFAMKSERVSHVFANPAGYLHEVLTVARATGLVLVGPRTAEFTWFIGYQWEIAHCERCSSHIGWAFTTEDASEPESFWGLRRSAIVEESIGEAP